jgi:hypothetical protein
MPTLGVATIKKKQRARILGGTESRNIQESKGML